MTASAVLMSSAALKKVIKTPSAVANTLDWRKASGGVATALAIDVHGDKLGLALATLRSETNEDGNTTESQLLWNRSRHPQLFPNNNLDSKNRDQFSLGFGDSFSCRLLDPIPMITTEDTTQSMRTTKSKRRRKRKRVICPEAKQILSELVREHSVCSFVVSWPVQQDTGLMGASCGMTLWAIEQLLENEEEEEAFAPFAPNRPLCLWQTCDAQEFYCADSFGRSSVFARTSEKKEHYASKEQYHLEDEPVLAAEVWMDFCEHHWPAAELATIPMGTVQQSLGDANSSSAPLNPVDSRYNNDSMSSRRRTLVAA